MASFKYKPNKIKYLDEITTLDSKHKEFATKFKADRENLDDKYVRKKELLKELKKLNSVKELDFDIIKKKGEIRRELTELEDQIKDIENGTSEINYYKEAGNIIIDYYNDRDSESPSNETKSHDIEERVEVEEEIDALYKLNELSKQKRKPKRNTKKRAKNAPTNRKTILEFFGINDKKEVTEIDTNKINRAKNKATLYEQYMGTIDTNYNIEKIRQLPMCETCSIEKLLLQSDGMYVCTSCGEFESVIIESDIPNYKDQLQEKPAYLIWVRRTGGCGLARVRAIFYSIEV